MMLNCATTTPTTLFVICEIFATPAVIQSVCVTEFPAATAASRASCAAEKMLDPVIFRSFATPSKVRLANCARRPVEAPTGIWPSTMVSTRGVAVGAA